MHNCISKYRYTTHTYGGNWLGIASSYLSHNLLITHNTSDPVGHFRQKKIEEDTINYNNSFLLLL